MRYLLVTGFHNTKAERSCQTSPLTHPHIRISHANFRYLPAARLDYRDNLTLLFSHSLIALLTYSLIDLSGIKKRPVS